MGGKQNLIRILYWIKNLPENEKQEITKEEKVANS